MTFPVSCRILLPAVFSCIVTILPAQNMNREEKKSFSGDIRTVLVWTHIGEDSLYRYYIDVLEQTITILGKKGYITRQVFYNPSKELSPGDWMTSEILKMSKGEAFLELVTETGIISTGLSYGGERAVQAVHDNKGVIQLQVNLPVTGLPDSANFCRSFAKIYLPGRADSSGALIPVYSRKDSLNSNNLPATITYVLAGIPRSASGPESSLSPGQKKKIMYGIELSGYGGYSTGATVQATGGTARYRPGPVAGFEFGIRINKKWDVIALYHWQSTQIGVESTKLAEKQDFRYSINDYLFGFNRNFRIGKVFSPFLGLAVGGVNTVPRDKEYRDTWYFAFLVRGGIKFYLTRFFGLRLQADFQGQLHPEGAPFIYTMDYYLIYPIDANSNLFLFGASGGVFFRIGE